MNDNRQLQTLLRHIVLPPENAAESIGAKNMPRIYGKTGVYYYNQPQNGEGKDPEKDPNEDPEKDPEGNNSQNDDDPRHDPSECPKYGDNIPGLKNMHDCQTGRCVNVNFTLPPRPPEGWEDACTPPPPPPPERKDLISYSYDYTVYKMIKVNASGKPDPEGRYMQKKIIVKGKIERDNIIIPDQIDLVMKDIEQFAEPMKWRAYNKGEAQYGNILDKEKILKELKEQHQLNLYANLASFANKTNQELGLTGYWDSLFSSNGSVTDKFITHDVTGLDLSGRSFAFKNQLVQPPKPQWQPETCAEMESTPIGFKPACEDKDPNLPPQLKGENTAIQLCDQNGEQVTITRNGKGWKVEAAHCDYTVDESGKVQSVQKKT